MNRVIFHGEVAFFEVDGIPGEAKMVISKADHIVVGESETHGNDHRVSVDDYTQFFTADDVLFIKSIGQTKVYCPNETRHDTVVLPDGVWKVGHAEEYDYFTESRRRVAD